MKKIRMFFQAKSLVKDIVLLLSSACIGISLLYYSLYFSKTLHILETQLAEQTKYQLSVNNQNMETTFNTVENIYMNLYNSLSQYDTTSSSSFVSKLNQASSLRDVETISFANYIIRTLDFYVANNPILDSISVYTRNGTIISSSSTFTKTQILQSESNDFILKNVIPYFDETTSSFVWLGSHKAQDFALGLHQYNTRDPAAYVITGIRRVISLDHEQDDIFFVFNLREEAIRNVYDTYPLNSAASSFYLIDADGKVLSSNHSETIGTLSPYAEQLKTKGEFVAFTEKENGQKQNLFYQSLDKAGWFILYVIPDSIYSSDITSFKNVTFLLLFLTLAMMLLAVFLVIFRKLKPIHELAQALTQVGKGNLGYTIPVKEDNEIGFLARKFNRMSRDLQEIMIEKEQAEEQKRLHEIASLQAQINPHFILNTINTIKWMAILNHVPNIEECLTTFGKLLEPLLKQKTEFYTVKEELAYLKNYVTIMNYNYGNTIHMELSVPDDLQKCRIPRFILQPLVENAVLHGVDKVTNEVQIEIVIYTQDHTVILDVYSYGTAIASDKLLSIQSSLIAPAPNPEAKTSSIGLTNINQRIKLFYGENFGLWIENSSDCQVKTTVTIPLEFHS